ncbi:T9SS type A sorting domain-containing protein [uncultured Dokdonia sp.]|uniref:T9SS type A sorting domain-containing protein n=1 Tax=uncultured Dokdonia sp. TaxID=575653 RepID=UPI002621C7B6|nr:T9SS type A sorting domain-containing protein [uncultured Dokdonia sp.]
MKKKYLLIISFLTVISINAQDFIEHTIEEVSGSFTSIRLHDLDNDGNIDIIGAINGASQLMAWFDSGNGNFENSIIIENEGGTPARDIEFLDINNDGNMDIIAVTNLTFNGLTFERLAYYINNGDRTFEDAVEIEPNFGSSVSNFLTVFDVNNDNLEDIVIRRIFNPTSIVYYPNTGNGSFGEPIGIINSNLREVFSQDFNDDGFTDIILGGGIPQLYINNGDATFSLSTELDDFPSAQFATLAGSGQLDTNQTEDIIFTNTNFIDTAGVLWYSNDGNANFTIQENITNPDFEGATYTITRVADFNNDGNNDLVSGVLFNTNNPTTGIPIWMNDDDFNFTPSSVISTSDNINNSLEVFDFNNDNKMDFIVGTFEGQLTWFENNLTLSVYDESITNLKISPNPSQGIYHIVNNQNASLFTINIYNTLGQKIMSIKNSDTIDLSAQPSGLYFAKIEDQISTKKTSRKLIKL